MSLRECSFGRVCIPLALSLLVLSSVAFAQDQSYPKVDVFAGYSWLDPGGSVAGAKLATIPKGFGLASTFNFNRYAGITIDGGGHWGRNDSVGTIMIGPRIMFRQEHFEPFIEGLFGLHRLGVDGVGTDNGVGVKLGGGIDVPIKPYLALRLIQADWAFSHHVFAVPNSQNFSGAELRSGLEFRFSSGPPPVPMSASCSIQPSSVFAGEPVSVTAMAANIPKNHSVTYGWNSTGGKVTGKDANANVDTTGLDPGSYTVTGTVTDTKAKKGQAPATCSSSFTVNERPKHPPTVSCSANPSTVRSGDPSTITATGNSPDDRPLTYSFRSSGGRLTSNAQQATLDTAGASAGPISITCTATDDRGLSASSNTSVNVEVPPPPPTASKLNEIQFKNPEKPARVDNEAKAILDDVALRLQRDADAKLVIVGNPGPVPPVKGKRGVKKPAGEALAAQRAVNTKAYLTEEKGIDPSRIEVRTGTADSSNAEMYIVPPGATFDMAGTQTFDESKVKPMVEKKPVRKPAAKKAAAPKS